MDEDAPRRKFLEEYGDLMTVQDLAEFLQVSARTVYRLVNSCELNSVKVGRRIYFVREHVAQQLGLGNAETFTGL